MDLQGIMLREISQRKPNTVWSHLYVQSRQTKLIETVDWCLQGGGGKGGEGGQMIQSVQTSAYLMSKFWGR